MPSDPTGAKVAKPRAVLGTVSSDAHGWNLVYLEMVLSEAGYRVYNAGPCSSVPDIVTAAAGGDTALVVLSSVNGHGCIEAPSYARALRADARTRSVPLVVGGQLTTDGDLGPDRIRRLRDAGFDQVFVGVDAMAKFHVYLAGARPLARVA